MDLIVLGKDRKIRLFPSMRRPMAAVELFSLPSAWGQSRRPSVLFGVHKAARERLEAADVKIGSEGDGRFRG
jgi:hypothetical protein